MDDDQTTTGQANPATAADPECLFCKILNGAIPAEIVAETPLSVAFRDVEPQAPTHCLVVPRSHVPTLPELAGADPNAAVDVLVLARRVAEQEGLLTSADGSEPPGLRLVCNNGAGAQQTVFHAHLHVLGGRPFTWPPG